MILDLRMPGLSGIQLQEELFKKNISAAIVFITGHGDIKTSVQAMKNGAVDFILKPYDQNDLLDAVERALKKDVQLHEHQRDLSKVKRCLSTLTEREGQVLRWVISGRLNKQIALELGITEKTIKVHRGKMMEKMKTSSVAELVRLAELADIPPISNN